ncbi:uncharacterized protein LOC120844154 [Ixodes scapularis]|uniref:uncharacterized protein LOC120844154 n=1 Tax=Ixodes scapularis TaxID=6945 RepID=UPI001A9FA627|nr:uncharacterized protein LOC120844154 [Ixodes scapularis]
MGQATEEATAFQVVLTGFGGFDKVTVGERVVAAVDELGDADVWVRVRACGLNFADNYVRQGIHVTGNLRPPLVMGAEAAGDVVQVGDGVRRIKAVNGKAYKRHWLMYSKSKSSVYCFMCKLFSTPSNPSSFTRHGFCDWRRGEEKVCAHENSVGHRTSVAAWLSLSNSGNTVDKELVKHLVTQAAYWTEVLKRVVKLLAERSLAFRGSEEVLGSLRNVNYKGVLKAIAQFDPFLGEHIKRHGKKVKRVKYFSLIIGSTSDLTHVDQLDQAYGNASNMSGKYKGQQAQVKLFNKLAVYVPCAGHSLNFVGACSVDSCLEAVQFFSLTQKLYAFFVASPKRWKYLLDGMSGTGEHLVLKSLSETR